MSRSRVFKKRPRVFSGTQRYSKKLPGASTDSSTSQARVIEVEKPVPVETASTKKLGISLQCSESLDTSSSDDDSYEYVGTMKGYRLVSCERFSKALTEMGVCSVCEFPLTILESLMTRRGLVSNLMICCTNNECGRKSAVCDPYSLEAKSLNIRSVLGMRAIGRGRACLETFCGFMDMLPPVVASSYGDSNRHLAKAYMECAHENMRAAAVHLHRLHGVDSSETIDVAVTCDGTWSKRGFTATHGVVVVISWESDQVLDFEIKSKRCTVCSRKKAKMDETSEEFAQWWDSHKNECEMNHSGSSPAMECAGALEIWKRSEEKLCLRFTEVICDGDSKTLTTLRENKPYGDEVTINKHECVGHVQKRVGKRLRAVKKVIASDKKAARAKVTALKNKLKSLKDEKKGSKGTRKRKRKNVDEEVQKLQEDIKEAETHLIEGVMNDGTVDLLEQYYGNAIRSHQNDLDGMKKACWAVFYHSLSTNEKPQHEYCPVGAESWCKYQRAVPLHQDVPPHSTKIPAAFERYVKPIFSDLCKEELLERCLLGATQNRNECFNSLVWASSPKTEFTTKATIEIATCHAVLVFNSGRQSLLSVMERLKIPVGPLCKASLATGDSYRIKRSQYRETELAKKRRKSKRVVEKSVEEAFRHMVLGASKR